MRYIIIFKKLIVSWLKLFNDFTIYFFQIFQDLLRINNTFQRYIITAVIALFVVIDPLGNPIYKVLGNRWSMIVSRIFAVIIVAIAVEHTVERVKNLFVV